MDSHCHDLSDDKPPRKILIGTFKTSSKGSINQPSSAPLSIYSCIFSCNIERRSVGERNSTTKSGQSGANPSRCSVLSASHRSRRTHETSGERLAPLGRVKSVEESKTTPEPSMSAHAVTR